MAAIRKFDFDLSFDAAESAAPSVVIDAEPLLPPPPPEPVFSAAELEAARQEAFERGHAEGHATATQEAGEAAERRLSEASERLVAALGEAGAAQRLALDAIERQAAELALELLRKLFPALAARGGIDELAALISEVLALALDQPRLTIRCAEAMRDALEAIARRAAHAAGYEGRLAVIADDRLGTTDCRVEWAEGGVERDTRQLMQTVETALARGIEAFDGRTAARIEECA
jgi:flagellar assembly protein FliH